MFRARLGAGQCHFRAETVEPDPICQPRLGRHRSIELQIRHLPAREALAVQDRLISHRGENRAEALPRDVLTTRLDPRDCALARAGAMGELALAESVLCAQVPDELAGSHDAVYGIRDPTVHTGLSRQRRGSAPSCEWARGGAPSGSPD